MVKVTAKATVTHGLFEVAVAGGDDAHVGLQEAAANALKLTRLEHPQHLRLGFEWQLAHFIQEEGAAVSLLETAHAARNGARESAFLVAEQFAFDQCRWQGGAIDSNEQALLAVAVAMDRE